MMSPPQVQSEIALLRDRCRSLSTPQDIGNAMRSLSLLVIHLVEVELARNTEIVVAAPPTGVLAPGRGRPRGAIA